MILCSVIDRFSDQKVSPVINIKGFPHSLPAEGRRSEPSRGRQSHSKIRCIERSGPGIQQQPNVKTGNSEVRGGERISDVWVCDGSTDDAIEREVENGAFGDERLNPHADALVQMHEFVGPIPSGKRA